MLLLLSNSFSIGISFLQGRHHDAHTLIRVYCFLCSLNRDSSPSHSDRLRFAATEIGLTFARLGDTIIANEKIMIKTIL